MTAHDTCAVAIDWGCRVVVEVGVAIKGMKAVVAIEAIGSKVTKAIWVRL